jgi:hypothetical protein
LSVNVYGTTILRSRIAREGVRIESRKLGALDVYCTAVIASAIDEKACVDCERCIDRVYELSSYFVQSIWRASDEAAIRDLCILTSGEIDVGTLNIRAIACKVTVRDSDLRVDD